MGKRILAESMKDRSGRASSLAWADAETFSCTHEMTNNARSSRRADGRGASSLEGGQYESVGINKHACVNVRSNKGDLLVIMPSEETPVTKTLKPLFSYDMIRVMFLFFPLRFTPSSNYNSKNKMFSKNRAVSSYCCMMERYV